MRKQKLFGVFASLLLTMNISCNKSADDVQPDDSSEQKPLIEISDVVASANSVRFTITPTDAIEYEYAVNVVGEEPSYTSVRSGKSKEYQISGLEQGVDYEILALAYDIDLRCSEKAVATFFTESIQTFDRTSLALKFTATWCGNCPAMTAILDAVVEEDPASLAVVAIHTGEYAAHKDLCSKGGDELVDEWNVTSLPTTYLDYREKFNNTSMDVVKSALEGSAEYAATSKIDITSSVEDGELRLSVKSTFGATARYKIGVVITENNIYEPNTDGSLDGYYHHVAREFLTSPLGDALGNQCLGAEVERLYACTLSDEWSAQNLEITAYIFKEERSNCYYVNNAAVAPIELN